MNTALCNSRLRRDKVRQNNQRNGIDYLEVGKTDQQQIDLESQRHLRVYFLNKVPVKLDKTNILIEGGRRVRGIRIISLKVRSQGAGFDDFMDVVVDKAGDFSTYTLRIVEKDEKNQARPHSAFDPRYDRISFSFKVDCPSDLDCKTPVICPPETAAEPDIDYLAKDYASFKQLILDRLALIMPEWKERHVPDIGLALVEVLAYVGDHLSYYQDAVATEAYLDTARQRISVRRHARLIDYKVHEGCNARAWVCVEVYDTEFIDFKPEEIYFVTRLNDVPQSVGGLITEDELRKFSVTQYEVFEPMMIPMQIGKIRFYRDHNVIRFYTWGERECCLPRGATSATLWGKWIAPERDESVPHCHSDDEPRHEETPSAIKTVSNANTPELHLRVGDILIFQEIKGPKTEHTQDADPAHRHAVRLTRVEADIDPLNNQAITHIDWADEDALPFPLCLSSMSSSPDCKIIEDVSVACGNVILVDHGKKTIEELGIVPKAVEFQCCIGERMIKDGSMVAGRYDPVLGRVPLTFSQPLPETAPASSLLKQEVRDAIPQVNLTAIPASNSGNELLFSWTDFDDFRSLVSRLKQMGDASSRMLFNQLSSETKRLIATYDNSAELSDELKTALRKDLCAVLAVWLPQYDLLGSNADDRHFAVEMDDNRRAHIRFGADRAGMKPAAGMSFQASYRIGNGPAGNVGAGAIAHMVWSGTMPDGVSIKVNNPLPAQGGMEPEPMAEVKLFAPGAFRKQLERAVIADDYATIAVREFENKVQNAAARLRWNGSWYEVLTAIDPFGKEEADQALVTQITMKLHRYRRMGHDLIVKPAIRVPLEIKMKICVAPGYLRGHVKAELLSVFGNKLMVNGRRGFFHPDELSFGSDIYLSRLVAAAQAVTGVESVEITMLNRMQQPADQEIENGVLPLAAFEIARCDNDPGFPEYGKLELEMWGGR